MRKQTHVRDVGFSVFMPRFMRLGVRIVHNWNPDWFVLMLLPVLFAVFFCLLLGLGVRVFSVMPVAFLALSLLVFLTTIVLCDGGSRQACGDYPYLRTSVCACLGAIMSVLFQSMLGMHPDLLWIVPGLLVGGWLGWLGVGWTRFLWQTSRYPGK